MPAPSSKSMLVLAVLAVVLSASLLLVSIPGYDGEDGAGAAEDQTTTDWSEAKAVVFNNKVPTGYKTIQAAIDSIVGKGTVYVAKHQLQEGDGAITIQDNRAITLRLITINGNDQPIEPKDETVTTENDEPTITRAEGYQGPLFHISLKGGTSGSSPSLTIEGMTISGGSSQGIKATDPLIIIAEGSVKISQSKLCYNNNTSSLGGAVRCEEGAEVELISSEITGCRSTKGGAVYSSGGLTVRDTIIRGNTSAGDGSAIYSDGLSGVLITCLSDQSGGSIVEKNNSQDGSGQITIVDSNLTINRSTVGFNDGSDFIIEFVASDVLDSSSPIDCIKSTVYGSIVMTVEGSCQAAWLIDMIYFVEKSL